MSVLRAEDFPAGGIPVTTNIAALRADPQAMTVLRRHLGELADMDLPDEALSMSLLDLAVVAVGIISPAQLHAIADELAELPAPGAADRSAL